MNDKMNTPSIEELKTKIATLEKALQEKERFFANAVHEIRTPISSVMGFTELIDKTSLNNEQANYIAKIEYSSKHLASLVNDILDVSKINSGKLQIENIVYSFDKLLQEINYIIEIPLTKKKLQLNINKDPHLENYFKGDSLRISQVLINLLTNAIKFTSQGTVSLTLNLKEKDEKESIIEFTVTDEGIGLTEKQIKNLFQSFTQAETSTSREYGGTGLGLVICKKLVELMGGNISVTSIYGKGSAFTFTLPLEKATQEMFQEKEEKNEHTTKRQKLKKSLQNIPETHIILAEDNPINQSLIKTLLKDTNIILIIAENGQEVLEIMQYTNNIDLILMDIQMPILDGFETTEVLRQNNELDHIPIIALSGNTRPEDKQKSQIAGMQDYLMKPLDSINFYESLIKYLTLSSNKEETIKENIILINSYLDREDYLSIMKFIEIQKGNNKNENFVKYLELIEESILNYQKIFLVLASNYFRVFNSFLLQTEEIKKTQKVDISKLIRQFKHIDTTKEITASKLIDFDEIFETIESSIHEKIKNFHLKEAIEACADMRIVSEETGLLFLVQSISPIQGIQTIQRKKIQATIERLNKYII